MSNWKRRLQRFDWGYLVVLAICLLAVWPFLANRSLPEGTDAELHIFRLHELSILIRGGEFYPRWAPDFYHGYGYPIFNYYAPLTYYLGLLPELLPRVDAVGATKIVFIAGLLLAGIGLYGFVRDNWSRRAGYVAAALYVYAPYVQYIDPHLRGVLPESFSFAAFALALWSLDRLRRRPSPRSWLASVVLVAAVVLSHNLMGLLFFGLLAGWVAWQLALRWRERRSPGASLRGTSLLFGALGLGLGLAAFFWLPVILERNAVTLTTLLGSGDNYDFRTHFLSLCEMASFTARLDWGATQSPLRFNLGVVQWIAGLLAVVLIILNRVRHRARLVYFAVALVALLFLMLPVSEPIWEALPFMPYFQFPWRLLGGAAAMLAVLGGAAFDGLLALWPSLSDRAAAGLTAAAVALPLLFALPLSQPAPWLPFGEVNTLRMSQIENSGRWLGTTSTSDYVPATVITIPQRRAEVVAPLAQGLPPDRVNYEALPDGATVETENVRPLLIRYRVMTPKQFRLRLYQFDFPGWRVTVDGQPAQTELAEPEGFIVVIVPQGDHVVEIRFGSTPARTGAWLVTIGSLVAAAAVAMRLRRSGGAEQHAGEEGGVLRRDWPVAAVGLAAVALSAVSTPLGWFHDHSQGMELDSPAVTALGNLGDQIALLGFTPQPAEVEAGETIDVSLYWRALRTLDIDYQSFVHVMNESGELVAQSDRLNPGDFPTHRWPLDKYVPDPHRIQLPPDLPPGRYIVRAGMWVQSEGWRLPFLSPTGEQIGDTIPLFFIEVQ